MTHFADLPSGRIHYDDVGAGDAVLLLHGLGLDLRMWDDQVPALAARHRVVRMDLHGFGQSSLPSGPYSHGEIIAALLTTLGIERAHVVGLSYGGAVAAQFVQEHAERVRSLVLVDSDVWGIGLKTLGPSLGKIRDVAKTDVAAAKKMWLEHTIFDAARRQPAVIARIARMIDDYSGWHFAYAGTSLERKPEVRTVDALASFEVPALVVIGQHDVSDFHHIADEVMCRLPGARKVVLSNVGHMSNMEDPAAFNRVLIAFLEGTG